MSVLSPQPQAMMMNTKRVLFLQLEVFTNCAPHIGMCLFINDLRHDGIDCSAYLVNYECLQGIFQVIEDGGFSLICMDSTFTVQMVNALTTQFPDIPILVGGVNAIALFLHTDASFAVFGPGRIAARQFMAAFFGNQDFSKVTNLFYKVGRCINYSGRTQHWDLPKELSPYEPCLDWGYVGPERKPNANTEAVSVIAGTGCPYAGSTKSTTYYNIGKTIEHLRFQLTDRALQRLDEIFNRQAHGCSFCIFQLQEYRAYPPAKTVDMLLSQAQHLFTTHDTRAFPIQTENPFPFLNDFLHKLLSQGIPLEFVSIRTRPDILVKHQPKLVQALETAIKNDVHVSIEEIGFESFLEKELVLFNKGIHVETNMRALEVLRDVKQQFNESVSVHVGHGMILFHPWTTIESLSGNLQVMAQYPDVFSRFYAADLTLYSEFAPIFSKVFGEGLAVEAAYSYGWDYTPIDPLATKAFDLYRHAYSCIGPDIDIPVFINALRQLEDHSIEQILISEFHLALFDE